MNTNTRFIKLSDLWLDINILNMVQKQGFIFPEELEENLVNLGTFPLQQDRLERIKKLESSIPISVQDKPFSQHHILYKVLDGRHRIANCILQGKKEIECILVS